MMTKNHAASIATQYLDNTSNDLEHEVDDVEQENALDQHALERTALERTALERMALERTALERTARDPRAVHQRARDQRALDRRAFDQRALDRRALDQQALEQKAFEQKALDQPGLEQRLQRSLGTEPILHKELSYEVVGAAIEVHRRIGPGMLESVYQRSLELLLRHRGIPFVAQAPIAMRFMDADVGEFFADFIIDDKIILEIKSVEHYSAVHRAQLYSYLTAANLNLGMLINFNVPVLVRDIRRVVR